MLPPMYQSSGTLKLINDTQTFPSGFSKREFVVTTSADRYPQDLKFEVVKEKTALLDQFAVGQPVTVSFDIRGNEYNGKYYVNLSAWKLEAGQGEAGGAPPAAASAPAQTFSQPDAAAEPSADDLRSPIDEDDIPF